MVFGRRFGFGFGEEGVADGEEGGGVGVCVGIVDIILQASEVSRGVVCGIGKVALYLDQVLEDWLEVFELAVVEGVDADGALSLVSVFAGSRGECDGRETSTSSPIGL